MAPPGARAQTEDPAWIDSDGNPGRILVSRDGVNEASTPITVNFNGSKSFTYWIKLSAPPNRDGVADSEEWWIRIFVDGGNRIDGKFKGIRWVPSVGWYFNQNTWNTWRLITFRVDENYDEEANGPRATSLRIAHEVFATDQWCPLHDASPINVNVDGNGGGGQPPTENTDNPPSFSAETATRRFSENLGDPTEISARNIGATVWATGAGPITYSLEGTDPASLDIDTGTGQLKTIIGEDYDHEAGSSYSVTVRASNSFGSDTIDVTVELTDLREPPLKPDAPTVTPDPNDSTILSIGWTPPSNDGRPDISGYNLRYRAGTSGGWTNGPQNVNGPSATLIELSGNTFYQVQVQAKNDEGVSLWSDAGDARTDNSPPEFSETIENHSFEENLGDATTSIATNLDAPIRATDEDNDTLTYSLDDTAKAHFAIDERTGQLRTKVGGNYDHEERSSYSVTVEADDGTASVTVPVTVRVTDREEPPLRPAAPVVSTDGNSTTSLSVRWTAPLNAGRPAITGYNLKYWASTSGSSTAVEQNVDGRSTTTTITGLEENTEYQVQVQAINDEGTGPLSPSGSGRTNAEGNDAPRFPNDLGTRDLDENEGNAATGTGMDLGAPFTATDDDNDTLTYSLEGPDAQYFTVVPGTGQIRTKPGVTYDHETTPTYTVTLKVSDGTASDTMVVTIDVNDLTERPQAPAAPRVRTATGDETGLSVTWNAPPNRGRPPITGYDLQYRAGPDAMWPEDTDFLSVTGTSTTIPIGNLSKTRPTRFGCGRRTMKVSATGRRRAGWVRGSSKATSYRRAGSPGSRARSPARL